jgi:hypothetical protein
VTRKDNRMRQASKPTVYLQETATPERLAKVDDAVATELEVDPAKADRGAPLSHQRIVAAPLDRLWRAGVITQREYTAGDWLRADAYLAAIDPGASSVDWMAPAGTLSGKIPSMFSAQHIADARIRYRDMQKRMRGVAWSVLYTAVISEATLYEVGRAVLGYRHQRDAPVAATAALRVALCALADRYDEGGPRQRYT